MYGIKIYEARKAKKTSAWTWRLSGTWGERSGPRLSEKLIREAMTWAIENNVEFKDHIRHGDKLILTDLEALTMGLAEDEKAEKGETNEKECKDQ